MQRTRRSRNGLSGLKILAILAVGGLALAGCTASRPAATPTAAVSSTNWPTAQLFKTGRASTTLVVPSGAKSLHVDFSCTYGLYSVSPQLGVDTRSGMCGGAQTFDFDLGTMHAGAPLGIDFVVPDDTRFAATAQFSTRAFKPDLATEKQCASLSKISEAYWNADEGYDHKDVSDAQWIHDTADAKTSLTALASTAEAHPEDAGLLGQVIPQLAAWLTGDGYHPGAVLHPPLGDFAAANSLVGQICSANGTPLIIHSKYGG
jgi:hypothetical protein